MNPYVVVHLDFGPKTIFETFSISTSVGDSIEARKSYRGCTVSIFHRVTLVGLVELDMVDFDDIFGLIGSIRAMPHVSPKNTCKCTWSHQVI